MMNAYFYAIITSVFWGAGFIGSRFGLEAYSPMWVTFFRFMVGFLVGVPLIGRITKQDITFKVVWGAFLSAVMLTGVMFLQIKGLAFTTVAKSGFITILYAFFTPILYRLFYKKKLSKVYWSLLLVALFGMFLLAEMNISNLNYGDFLTLCCSIFSAFHILSIGHFSKYINNFSVFNTLQLFFVALITLPLAIYGEGIESINVQNILSHPDAYLGIIFMGVFSTAIGFLLQCKSQSKLPAHLASLIFLLESPFAAIMAFFIFNEHLSSISIIGCAVVVSCVALISVENKLLNILKVFKNIKIKPILRRKKSLPVT